MRNAPALHGRDHCPGGSDPIPCMSSSSAEFAWLECTTQPTADGNSGSLPTLVPWDTFSTTNEDVFTIGAGSTTLQCLAPGAYTFEVKALFFDVGAKVAAVLFGTIVTWTDGGPGVWFAHNNYITNTDPAGTAEIGIRDFATGYLNPTGTFAGTKTVGIEMWNFDAIDHDMQDCYLKAVYVPGSANLVSIF